MARPAPPAPDRWKAQLKTQGQSDVYVVDNKFPPGASTGWHSHPGPSLILVVTGTVTNYPGNDPSCTRVPTARGRLHRPGGGRLHMLRNETGDVAETIAVQLLPKDAARRIPDNAPSGCPPSVGTNGGRIGGCPPSPVPHAEACWRR
jgi:hypothetical protein